MLTNHCLDQYAFRTGRKPQGCAEELINGIKSGQQVDLESMQNFGFKLAKSYEGDTYHVWYDAKIKDYLLAIVAKTGTVVTILRTEMFGRHNPRLEEKLKEKGVPVHDKRRKKRMR